MTWLFSEIPFHSVLPLFSMYINWNLHTLLLFCTSLGTWRWGLIMQLWNHTMSQLLNYHGMLKQRFVSSRFSISQRYTQLLTKAYMFYQLTFFPISPMLCKIVLILPFYIALMACSMLGGQPMPLWYSTSCAKDGLNYCPIGCRKGCLNLNCCQFGFFLIRWSFSCLRSL